jgi:hypothetical protein
MDRRVVMAKEKERVLVVAPLECKSNADGTVVVTRIRALGLTAYGANWEEARGKLYRMYATWVGLHRQSGNLEQALNASSVEWYYESQYTGGRPYHVVLPKGGTRLVARKKSITKNEWEDVKELVAAN